MSGAAWRLFQKSYPNNDSGRQMPLMLLLVKCAADDLSRTQEHVLDTLRALKYEAPIDQWEEMAMWELEVAQRELIRVLDVLTNAKEKISSRVRKRWEWEWRQQWKLEAARLEAAKGEEG